MFMSFLRNSRFRSKLNLRKQPTFHDAHHRLPTKWRLRNKRRNSILMTRHFWLLKQIFHASRPIKSTTHIWVVDVVTRHQYGIMRLFRTRHFARKPEVASQNVGCWCPSDGYQYGVSIRPQKSLFFSSQNRFRKAQTAWYSRNTSLLHSRF